MAVKWGVFGWLFSGRSTPLMDVFTQASADMVDIHISEVFYALQYEDSYLRIQDDTLMGRVSSVDIATKENFDILVATGEATFFSSDPRIRTGINRGLPNFTDSMDKSLGEIGRRGVRSRTTAVASSSDN
ncbi:hypothetical protein ACH5RR_035012 [Cinchona calisaya]|uniref:Uncharacterized protein n=1 Tax=Cinchona calisaya TaxID=153742 RepID=A0ABD2YDX6_9GENT